ncbi:WecB/TagA/CpsF family glycosyltransferase [Oscillospiraceae bacterium CM]|nr:WecB/TagA/CpsF family glycosyltransferase [Oscillospiraceae bacterium CM]
MRTDVYGVGFDNLTMEEAVGRAEALLEAQNTSYVVTPNPEIVWLCRSDPELKEIISGAALVLPDGIGVVYGAKILGRPLKGKLAGIEFAEKLMESMARTNKSIFLLGAKPGIAEKAAENLANKYPGLAVAGTADGYFQEDGPVVEKINNAKPDLLLVCLGAPKQERWMARNLRRLNVRVMAGLGGSLDVYAGVVARAPDVWIKLHLEWLYRLKKEPWRWRRMTKLPLFVLAVIGWRLRGK